MSLANEWTVFFRQSVEEIEDGLPHLNITDAMYEEFGKAVLLSLVPVTTTS